MDTNKDLKEGILLDNMFQNGMFNFKEKFSDKNLNSQSNLLRNLRMHDDESLNHTEIIVRPIAVNTNKYDEGLNKKQQHVNLSPIIKNFRLNSFDFHGEFNLEKHAKSTKILKPLTDFNLKSNSSLSNKNYELATLKSNQLKPVTSTALNNNKSINYLAAGILNSKNTQTLNESSLASLNRKLDLEDFEYYDVNELFKKNPHILKSGFYRKKLSQINEESTIDGTPLTNSRWSSSLSNFSGRTIKLDAGEAEVDIWSDIDENDLHFMNQTRSLKKSALPLPTKIE